MNRVSIVEQLIYEHEIDIISASVYVAENVSSDDIEGWNELSISSICIANAIVLLNLIEKARILWRDGDE